MIGLGSPAATQPHPLVIRMVANFHRPPTRLNVSWYWPPWTLPLLPPDVMKYALSSADAMSLATLIVMFAEWCPPRMNCPRSPYDL